MRSMFKRGTHHVNFLGSANTQTKPFEPSVAEERNLSAYLEVRNVTESDALMCAGGITLEV